MDEEKLNINKEKKKIDNKGLKLKEQIARMLGTLHIISYPRLIGSDGEKEIRNWLKKQIEDLGFKPEVEQINVSFYRINILQGLSNLVAVLLFIGGAFLYSISPFLFLIPLVFILLNIYIVSTGSIEMGQPPAVPKFVKQYETENIYVELLSDEPEYAANIVFIGHTDTKSTRLTGIQRIILYSIQIISATIYLIIGTIGLIYWIFNKEIEIFSINFIKFSNLQLTGLLGLIFIITTILGALSSFILIWNTVSNKSPGACDNGTAIVNVLETLRYFNEHRIPGVNFTFLFSAAEEVGLTGAYNFIKKRKNLARWDPERTFVINWDLAGLPGPIVINTGIGIPKRDTSPTINKFLPRIIKKLNIEAKFIYLPIGGWHDGLPWLKYGYESITISGISKNVHTNKDTPEYIDPENFYNSFVLGIEIAKELSKSNIDESFFY